jgi:hypothetical protein
MKTMGMSLEDIYLQLVQDETAEEESHTEEAAHA